LIKVSRKQQNRISNKEIISFMHYVLSDRVPRKLIKMWLPSWIVGGQQTKILRKTS